MTSTRAYEPRRRAHSTWVSVRNLHYHVQAWGQPQPGVVPLVMVHGWMDVGASFQFVVDALQHERQVWAPDLRGFGQTGDHGADNFWFPDYLADLDILLDQLAPDTPVDLVGHSMGGNIAMFYGGIRPERIRRLVNLEGFGLPATRPAQAAERYARWMNEIKALHRGELALRPYPSLEHLARRLCKNNPRLAMDKALWLARHWGEEDAGGQWRIRGASAHKIISAQLYRVDESLTLFQRLSMPVLAVDAEDDSISGFWRSTYTRQEYHERMRAVPQLEMVTIPNAGHMLHHDQPELLAQHIERFLA